MESTIVYAKKDLELVVHTIARMLDKYTIFAFAGSLGAGKTTLISRIIAQMGVSDPVVSPTFTYVNVYSGAGGKKIYHFDLYRIHSIEDFLSAGFDEYLMQPNSIVFIEWPEVIMPIISDKACYISLEYVDEKSRSMDLKYPKSR